MRSILMLEMNLIMTGYNLKWLHFLYLTMII
jgi:hypothetical protein